MFSLRRRVIQFKNSMRIGRSLFKYFHFIAGAIYKPAINIYLIFHKCALNIPANLIFSHCTSVGRKKDIFATFGAIAQRILISASRKRREFAALRIHYTRPRTNTLCCPTAPNYANHPLKKGIPSGWRNPRVGNFAEANKIHVRENSFALPHGSSRSAPEVVEAPRGRRPKTRTGSLTSPVRVVAAAEASVDSLDPGGDEEQQRGRRGRRGGGRCGRRLRQRRGCRCRRGRRHRPRGRPHRVSPLHGRADAGRWRRLPEGPIRGGQHRARVQAQAKRRLPAGQAEGSVREAQAHQRLRPRHGHVRHHRYGHRERTLQRRRLRQGEWRFQLGQQGFLVDLRERWMFLGGGGGGCVCETACLLVDARARRCWIDCV